MTSVISRVPSVLDYLVALFAADPTLGTATPPVTVYDGPVTTEDAPQLILWVGLDDPDSAPAAPLAADSTREWAGLAGQSEHIVIYCAAESWSGADIISAERVRAYGIVAAVETLVRTDATGFGGNSMIANPGVTGAQLHQNNTSRGAQARVTFQILLNSL
jgi:hypothetical protein